MNTHAPQTPAEGLVYALALALTAPTRQDMLLATEVANRIADQVPREMWPACKALALVQVDLT